MKLTTLFRLRKPDGTDPVNIEDFNDNFDVIDEELGKRLESTGNASDMTAAFTQASTRTNLKTGEKISASFGKIMKWFADLKTVAFSGSYSDLSNKPSIPSGAAASQAVANNCTTTAAGSVLDARQGKVLMDKANQLSSDLSNKSNVGHGHDVIAGMDNSGHSLQFKWTGSDLQFYIDKQGPFFSTANFQAGVDTLYSKCSSCGATPSAKTPTAIAGAIDKIYTDRYNAGFSAGKKAAEIKTVSKSATYPMAGVNGEQTVDFTVDFGSVSGYRLAYAGITALDTYISNSTIKYVQFSNLRISGTKATWSVHTARGTGAGNNTCTVQGIFIPA